SSDLGSLVYPASQHGLVTLKPSLGLVSRDHIIPITDALDTAGPLTRTVADAAQMMSILAGYDSNDPLTEQARNLAGTDWAGALQRDALRGVRVALVRFTLRPGDSEILDRAVEVLKRAGAEVVEAPNPRRIEFGELMEAGFKNALNRYLASVGGYTPVRSLAEIIAFNRDDLERRAPYGQSLLEQANADTTSQEQHAWRSQELRAEAAALLERFMGEQRVDLVAALSNYLTTFYAPAGFPAVCVPCSTRASGEPVGLTLIGPYLSDARLLSAAFAFECARDA
ncbi:MAG TPA: amidase family protein, partial [Roseiflexaceae bacterium]|nr:amidase family protein [Roseiflexaceae bacterium]